MPDFTAINGYEIPLLNDPDADMNAAAAGLINDVDRRVVPRFATPAARDTAIPSPTHGMFAYANDTEELYVYNGTVWVGAVPRMRRITGGNVTLTSATYTDLTGLSWPVEVNSVYQIEGILDFNVNSTDDIKFTWTVPAGTTGFWAIQFNTTAGVSVVLDSQAATTGVGEFYKIKAGYFVTTGTAGTVQMRAAKVTDLSSDGTVFATTTAWLTKVG